MLWRQTGRIFRRGLLLLSLIFIWLWAGILLIPRDASSPKNANVLATTIGSNNAEVIASKVERDVLNEDEETTSNPSADPSKRPWFMVDGSRRPTSADRTNKLFPGDIPNSDRIIEQLMYTLEDEDVSAKRILIPNGVSAWNVEAGSAQFAKCPVSTCILTADKKHAATADAILFKDNFLEFRHKRPSFQIWIMYYLECPYHTPTYTTDQINWTATYRRDSDIVAPYERWVYFDPPVPPTEINYATNKTKKVAWFVSNCHARNNRLEYARQLSKYIPVDIYGACGTHRCPRNDPYCLEMLNKDYKFYLAFENSNCKDYITEKFFVNGLGHTVIPIVMGARFRDYENVAPKNSFIHVDEFQSPEELAKFLHYLDTHDDLYNSYLKWKGTGEFINTYFWCRLCAMLHASESRDEKRHYDDLGVWWRNGACTKKGWRALEQGQRDYDP